MLLLKFITGNILKYFQLILLEFNRKNKLNIFFGVLSQTLNKNVD